MKGEIYANKEHSTAKYKHSDMILWTTCLTLLWPVGGDRGLNRGRDRKEEGGAV